MMKGKSSFQRAIPGMDSLRRRRTLLLSILLMLDGFALGGCVTAVMMRNLVWRMMALYRDQAQVLAVYNLLDHLISYYVCYGGAVLALTLATGCVWFLTDRRGSANVPESDDGSCGKSRS